MDEREKQSLIDGCLRYIAASRLPTPLPNNPREYAEWKERVAARPESDEDAEDAWFELDRLLANEPDIGWEVLIALARRCNDEDGWATLAVGPLDTFLHAHGEAFASRIDEELIRNAGFHNAYVWRKL